MKPKILEIPVLCLVLLLVQNSFAIWIRSKTVFSFLNCTFLTTSRLKIKILDLSKTIWTKSVQNNLDFPILFWTYRRDFMVSLLFHEKLSKLKSLMEWDLSARIWLCLPKYFCPIRQFRVRNIRLHFCLLVCWSFKGIVPLRQSHKNLNWTTKTRAKRLFDAR